MTVEENVQRVDDFIDDNEVQYDDTLEDYIDDDEDIEYESDDETSESETENLYIDSDDSNVQLYNKKCKITYEMK